MSQQLKNKSEIVKDSTASWILALACFFISFIIFGINRVSGVFFVAYRSLTDMSREMASWPFNISGASAIVVSPLCGFLSTKLSLRVICMIAAVLSSLGTIACFFSLDLYYMSAFYGIIRGAGVIMWANTLPSVINQNFDVHRTSAFGIASTGTPIGSFVFPALTQYCLEEYGLMGAFLLSGGMTMQACIGAMLLGMRRDVSPKAIIDSSKRDSTGNKLEATTDFNSGNKKGQDTKLASSCINQSAETTKVEMDVKNQKIQTNNSNSAILLHIIKSPHFYLILLAQNAIVNMNYAFTLVSVDFTIDKGVKEHDAIWILTTFSVGEVIGRLGLGWVTDKHFISRPVFTAVNLVLSGISVYFLTVAENFITLSAISVLIGTFQGTILSATTVMITDFLRAEALTWTMSLIRISGGILLLLRAPIIGYYRDYLGKYDDYFIILGGISVFVGLLWTAEVILGKLKKNNKTISEEDNKRDAISK